MSLINNLRLCDNRLDDEWVKYSYFHSLPTGVRTYIGNDYKKMTSIDEIFRSASEHLASIKLDEKKLSDGAMAPRREMVNAFSMNSYYRGGEEYDPTEETSYEGEDYIDYHALQVQNKREEDPQEGWRKLNTASMTCFHCGKLGHSVMECRFINQPQTVQGSVAWAKRNAYRGSDQVYDKTFYIRKNPSSSSPSSSSSSRPSSSPSPRRGGHPLGRGRGGRGGNRTPSTRGGRDQEKEKEKDKEKVKETKEDATVVSSSSDEDSD